MISAWTYKEGVWASYRKDGQLEVRRLGNADYTAYIPADTQFAALGITRREDDFPGWKKLYFSDYDARKRVHENNPGILFEADVSPVRRFMSDHKCVIDRPLRAFFDIETDPEVPFSRKEETRLLCAVVTGEDERSWKLVLEDDCDEAEAELWEAVEEALSNYDQICAWNGENFDFPVREARIERLMKFRKFERYWENRRRLLLVDHLQAYKRFNTASESGEEKTSMGLNSVAMALLGKGKHDYKVKNAKKDWQAGGKARQDLVDYCEVDVALMPAIEEKTGFLETFQTLCSLTTALPNNHGLKPMAQFDAMFLRKAHLKQTHLPSKIERGHTEKYEGAFVMESKIRGIARDVHVCDFASLYPSLIRTFNMGHDSKVSEGGCTVPTTGVHFATEYESMLGEIMRECMDLRVFWKKKKAALTPGTQEWKDADRKSTSYKVFVNSGYGVFGSPFGRYYDLDIVRSVTLSGQYMIKAVIAAAEDRGWEAVYGDTDSLFVQGCSVEDFRDFVAWCNATLFPKILAELGCNPKFACVKLSYEKCFDRIVVPQGSDGDPAGKRYAGSYKHYEGKPGLPICPWGVEFDDTKYSKPEIKGLEYKRADAIRFARRMQEECVMKILSGEEDPEHFEEWVKAKRDLVMRGALEVDDIVKTQGISRSLGLYKTNTPHVRVAKMLEAAGEDVSEGTRVAYITTNGAVSPAEVVPVELYKGEYDRHFYWQKQIYPPTLRVLASAFPNRNWRRWVGNRPTPALPGQLGLGLT